MPTVSRRLPEKPDLDVPKREARSLLKEWQAKLPEALDRVRIFQLDGVKGEDQVERCRRAFAGGNSQG